MSNYNEDTYQQNNSKPSIDVYSNATIPQPPFYSFSQQRSQDQRETVYGFLTSENWLVPMIQICEKSSGHIAIRYFLCDDSGSMYTNDGTLVKAKCG